MYVDFWLEKFYVGLYMSNPDAITQGVCDLLLCGILHRRMRYRVLFNKYAVQILYFRVVFQKKEIWVLTASCTVLGT